MEIIASKEKDIKRNEVGEDRTNESHMDGENIQNLSDPHPNLQCPVNGLSTMERDDNGLCGLPTREEDCCKENGVVGTHSWLSGLPRNGKDCNAIETDGDCINKTDNGDEKSLIPRYSSYPFLNPQNPLSGLLPEERDDSTKDENRKKNEAANAEPDGGEEDDCTSRIDRGKDNDKPPSKPSTFNGYKLVDDFIFCDRSLVGRFTRLRPSMQEIYLWSKPHWYSKLKSIWMFKTLGEGFFKIQFYDQKDCEFVLENGPWFMGVAGLTLKWWTPEFDPQNPGPLKTPVLMTLPDLPPELWSTESLIKICSAVGRVLELVDDTTEMSSGSSATARVCVEVDLSEGLMPTLDVQFAGISLKQELDYEGIPFRCKVCRSAEHLEASCPTKSTKTEKKKGGVTVSNGLWSNGKTQRT